MPRVDNTEETGRDWEVAVGRTCAVVRCPGRGQRDVDAGGMSEGWDTKDEVQASSGMTGLYGGVQL